MSPAAFDHLTPEQLRQLAAQLSQRVDHLETLNQRLNHELAVLRRHRFARRSEQLNADQLNLLDEMIEADIAAIEAELETARPEPAKREPRQQPKRAPLPAELPRTLILHEPAPSVPAAASSSASVKTSARSSTTPRAPSPSSGISVASGSAPSVKR